MYQCTVDSLKKEQGENYLLSFCYEVEEIVPKHSPASIIKCFTFLYCNSECNWTFSHL